MDYLMARGMAIPNRYNLCVAEAESFSYLFHHCRTAAKVWDYFSLRFRRLWVMQCSMAEVISEWSQAEAAGISIKGKFIWWCILGAICWGLWFETLSAIIRSSRKFLGPSLSCRRVSCCWFLIGSFICCCSKALGFSIGCSIGML